jgi:23S rRNA (adenine2503-C2)-methyltransferase
MIKDFTDTAKLANQLSILLKWKLAHVNLIPFNANPVISLQESDKKTIYKFKEILEQNWLTVTIRDSMWRKVNSACGQLGYEKINWLKD